MEQEDEEELEMLEDEQRFQETCNSYVAAIVSYIALVDQMEDDGGQKGRMSGSQNVKRERVPVERIFANRGERLLKKCHRKPEMLFWKLEGLLKPYLRQQKKCKRGATPNDDIPNPSRISMALR